LNISVLILFSLAVWFCSSRVSAPEKMQWQRQWHDWKKEVWRVRYVSIPQVPCFAFILICVSLFFSGLVNRQTGHLLDVTHVEIKAQVHDCVTEIRVHQSYTNNTKQDVLADFLLPVPDHLHFFVSSFTGTFQNRVVRTAYTDKDSLSSLYEVCASASFSFARLLVLSFVSLQRESKDFKISSSSSSSSLLSSSSSSSSSSLTSSSSPTSSSYTSFLNSRPFILVDEPEPRFPKFHAQLGVLPAGASCSIEFVLTGEVRFLSISISIFYFYS
jgi:hypothetical protein